MNPHFDGETYDPALDHGRLTAQLEQVRELMLDNKWRTLKQIEEATKHPQASISARLRDLRKPKFGGYKVNRHRLANGLFEYQVEVAGVQVPVEVVV